MGSLRTPVGPLPSAIYWRRRGVVLLLVAVVALLVFWAIRSTGGDSGNTAGQDDGKGPAESITPGPTPSESLIDERPGGRDEDEDADGGGDSDGEPDGDGEPGDEGDGEGNGADGDSGGTEGDGDGDAGGDPSGLPACEAGAVTLSLRSDANAYDPGQRPELRLTAQNGGDGACRLDLGHEALTLTLADDQDDQVFSSAECPDTAGSLPTAVPAGGTADHTVIWDLRHSVADCDAGQGQAAEPGTYLAEAELAGFPVVQTSFRLEAD
ncbi:hypothetical protein [Streptomyces profundus]|uniref:hypothetical protein n=1 Tax=Streptomyces profundus TaxID=2867410 RepID=UPI001D16B57C|nr:hypothetical protein [Streptomyces sp. MA3_2.13]UED85636.1 hypothetical protein K4G22_16720 [Streptomyces sp. MA3_2.13]